MWSPWCPICEGKHTQDSIDGKEISGISSCKNLRLQFREEHVEGQTHHVPLGLDATPLPVQIFLV